MDFIERIFGISPDGGNGLLEAGIFISFLALAAAGWVLRRQRS